MTYTQTEADARRILGCLYSSQIKFIDADSFEYVKSIKWTPMTIYMNCVPKLPPTAGDAIAWLLKREWVYIHRGEVFINSNGVEAHREAQANPIIPQRTQAFKDEALTGMTSAGNETKIDNAALPSPATRHATPRDIPKQLDTTRRARAIAAELGLPLEKMIRMIQKGADCPLRPCKGTEGVEPHIGMYTYRKGQRPGWPNKCNSCLAIDARQRRMKCD